jgi:hypothetical protein
MKTVFVTLPLRDDACGDLSEHDTLSDIALCLDMKLDRLIPRGVGGCTVYRSVDDLVADRSVEAPPPPPAPHIAPLSFSATSTPAGWIVSSGEGVVIAQLGPNQFRAEALATDLNMTLDSHRERATEDAARFARGLLGRLSGQP